MYGAPSESRDLCQNLAQYFLRNIMHRHDWLVSYSTNQVSAVRIRHTRCAVLVALFFDIRTVFRVIQVINELLREICGATLYPAVRYKSALHRGGGRSKKFHVPQINPFLVEGYVPLAANVRLSYHSHGFRKQIPEDVAGDPLNVQVLIPLRSLVSELTNPAKTNTHCA
jgi:hypothetical protein